MSWQSEVDEINRRREQAYAMGGDERVQKQRAQGKLSVRERIDLLYDPGTFDEYGVLADHQSLRPDLQGRYAAADGVVTGVGQVEGRDVFVFAEDFTVLGGTVGRTGAMKRRRMRELAEREKLPIVYLVDGAGARGQESVRGGWAGGEHFLHMARMSGIVPQVAGVLGPVGGDPALEVPLCDFKVMVRGTAMVAAGGPPLVESALGMKITKEELGGAGVHSRESGVVDNAVDSDEEAISLIRRYLSIMPANCWELPPRRPTNDPVDRRDDSLLSIVPKQRLRPYDMNQLIRSLVDDGEFLPIQSDFGRALIVGFAHIDGDVVGIQANQPLVNGGAFSGPEADKAYHFLSVCDAFNIPVIFLSDVPGFMVGPKSERSATLRRGLRVAYVMAHMRVPTVSVVVRKAYGMGAVAMNGPGAGQSVTLCWPSAEFGALPVEGGLNAAFHNAIEASDDPDAYRKELEERYRNFGSPFEAAKVFNFDDLIDPRDTRPRIAQALRRSRRRREIEAGPSTRHGIMP